MGTPSEHPCAPFVRNLETFHSTSPVGALTEQYRQRMYELLDLYARLWRVDEPVICVDEKSKQLLHESRPSLPMVPGTPVRRDYEYVRSEHATCSWRWSRAAVGALRRSRTIEARRTLSPSCST